MSLIRKVVKGVRHKAVGAVFAYTAGNMLQRLAVFLLIPFYTRTFSPAEFGLWGLISTIQMVLVSTLNMGMRQTIVRHYYDHAEDPERLKAYLSVSFFQRVATALVLGGIVLAFGAPAWNLLTVGQAKYWNYAPMLMIWVLGDLTVSYITGLFQAQRRPQPFIWSSIVKTTLQISLGVYFVVVTHQGVPGAVMGQAIGTISVGVVLALFHIRGYVRLKNLQWSDAVENFKYGYPLISHELAGWARNMSNRLILAQLVTMTMVGLYQFGYTFGLMLMVLIGGTDQAFSPFFFKAMKERGDEAKPLLRSVACVYAAGLVIVGAILCLFANEAVILIGKKAFWPAAAYAPLVVVAFVFHGQYTQVSKMLFYHKKTATLARITTISGIASILLNCILIPYMGAIGSIWVTWATYLAVFVGVYIASNRVDPISYPVPAFIAVNAVLSVIAIGCTYIGAGVPPTFGSIAIKLLILGGFSLFAWQTLAKPYGKQVFRTLSNKANKASKTQDQLVVEA